MSESMSKTFIPGPTFFNIMSIRESISAERSMLPEDKIWKIYANLANCRVLLKLLGGYVALDKVDVSHKTSA